MGFFTRRKKAPGAEWCRRMGWGATALLRCWRRSQMPYVRQVSPRSSLVTERRMVSGSSKVGMEGRCAELSSIAVEGEEIRLA